MGSTDCLSTHNFVATQIIVINSVTISAKGRRHMPKTYQTLTLSHSEDGRILEVRLNRPDEANALSVQMVSELHDVLQRLEADQAVRVLVLSGAGQHFCQGGDRSEFTYLASKDPSGDSLYEYGELAVLVCEALERLKIVSIAKLHGDVIGAGIGLAVFCDLRVGAATCRFRMPEAVLGLPPAWGGVLDRLQAESGQAAVRAAVLTGEAFDADRAQAMSILQKVVPLDELDSAVNQLAKRTARLDPDARRMTKEMLNRRAIGSRRSYGHDDPALMTHAYLTHRGRRQ